MAKSNIKIISAIIIIAIIAIAGYFLYDYFQKEKRNSEVNDYKKGFYEGMVCEYSCPLTPQEYKNKTQMLPELDCIKNCTTPFKTKYSDNNYKKEELEKDELLKDIDNAIKNCKKESINASSLSLNNAAYFNCASSSLLDLGEKYSYLN